MSRLFGEKHTSSVSNWIEILSSEQYDYNNYDGIPELVEAINLQSEGPTEASRAIRKKLKYGNVHRQIRALVILKALVENCGSKFQQSFADDRLTERLKIMATDSMTDEKVRKTLMSVLGSWHRQFKDNPSMKLVADLYNQCGGGGGKRNSKQVEVRHETLFDQYAKHAAEQRAKEKTEKEEAKRRTKEGKNKPKESPKSSPKDGEFDKAVKQTGGQKRRVPFNFEKEKPQIINMVATASQAANNLENAIRLVNREQETLGDNTRVQASLVTAKNVRKQILRYIQLVEDEELIGTLIDTNERMMAAFDMYEVLSKPPDQDSDDALSPTTVANRMAKTTLNEEQTTEASRYQQKQREAGHDPSAHPDLKDLNFDLLGESSSNLPAPLRPDAPDSPNREYGKGSLSDYSDYVSSDEETHRTGVSTAGPSNRAYLQHLKASEQPGQESLLDDADPFADPFAEQGQSDVGTPGIKDKRMLS
jgi:hypothetical protein